MFLNLSQFKVGDLGLLIYDDSEYRRSIEINWMFVLLVKNEHIYLANLIEEEFRNGYAGNLENYLSYKVAIPKNSFSIGSNILVKSETDAIDYFYKCQLVKAINNDYYRYKYGVPFLMGKTVSQSALTTSVDYLKEYMKYHRIKIPKIEKSIKIPKKPININGCIYKELERLVL